MATKKKKSQVRKKKTQTKTVNTTHEESFRQEIILWITLAVSIVLFVSNFGIGGKIGNGLSSFFFGLFGIFAYAFPIALFICVLFGVSNKGQKGQLQATVKIIAAVLLFISLCTFVQMLTNRTDVYAMKQAFDNGFVNKKGGGLIGGMFEQLLCPNFGKIGSFVITIIAAIIALVLLTERSAIRGVQKSSKKIYDTTRAEAVRHKAHQEEKRIMREEEKARRMDHLAQGVTTDTLIVPSADDTIQNTIAQMDESDDTLLPEVKNKRHVSIFSKTKKETSDDVTELHVQEASCEPIINQTASKTTLANEKIDSSKESLPTIETNIHTLFPDDEMTDISPEKEETSYTANLAHEKNTTVKKQSAKERDDGIAQVAQEINQLTAENYHRYVYPEISLLKQPDRSKMGDSKQYLLETAQKLEQTLKTFGVNVSVKNVSCGPAVTRYEIQPEMGVKVSKIVSLSDDIKLNLAAADIRIEAPIPGKAAVGIEVPNKESVPVLFRELIESDTFKNNKSPICFGVGKDLTGNVIVADIAKMPHLLIAGATGSGKSVCINTIIMSILYHADPQDVKLIMVDPKVVELSVYNGIPHLLIPVVTDPKKAAGALNWAVTEMTDRYQKFAQYNVRDLQGYNAKIATIEDIPDENKPEKLPQIVVIVDELADLMMVAPGDVEDAICRLAQLARACGIHLIIATQRPSVNVITGLIKANMPSRIAFSVSSSVDSRTILDMGGAEKLLGKGDMLFYPQGYQKPLRVQGSFVSDKEVQAVVSYVIEQNGPGSYNKEVEEQMTSHTSDDASGFGNNSSSDETDAYFTDAAKLIIDKDKASIGMLQRYFKIGFNRAARIMDQLEEAGIVGPEAGTKPREILMSMEQLENYFEQN